MSMPTAANASAPFAVSWYTWSLAEASDNHPSALKRSCSATPRMAREADLFLLDPAKAKRNPGVEEEIRRTADL
jgi:hypothetical protein